MKKQLEKTIEENNGTVTSLKSELQSVGSQIYNLNSQISEKDEFIEECTRKNTDIQMKIEETEKKFELEVFLLVLVIGS